MSILTPVQQQVLVLLAEGSTVSAAAETTGVHRNTIANWRRSSSGFRDTWARVQYEQSMHWRDEMQSLGALAVQNLRALLTDEKASPSVRLRAALAVLNKISVPAPVQPEYAEARRKDAQVDQALETLLGPLPNPGHELDNLAPDPYAEESPQPESPETVQPVHSSSDAPSETNAQSCTTVRHQSPVPGRNEVCSCGSGLKYKRCCLGKPPATQPMNQAIGQAA